MRPLEFARSLVESFSTRVAARRGSEFTCGDCDRWERCGLKPTDTCVIRAAQLARYDRRRLPDLYLLRW